MPKSWCTVCKHTFTTVRAFDLHRAGSFRQRTRRCMTEQEMLAKGMTRSRKGWWVAATRGKVPPWAKPLGAAGSRQS
jgi:hypothetical protein